MSRMKYDVFISYSRKDIDVANKFREVRKFKEFSEIGGKTSNPKLLKLFKFPNLPITTHKSPSLPISPQPLCDEIGNLYWENGWIIWQNQK